MRSMPGVRVRLRRLLHERRRQPVVRAPDDRLRRGRRRATAPSTTEMTIVRCRRGSSGWLARCSGGRGLATLWRGPARFADTQAEITRPRLLWDTDSLDRATGLEACGDQGHAPGVCRRQLDAGANVVRDQGALESNACREPRLVSVGCSARGTETPWSSSMTSAAPWRRTAEPLGKPAITLRG
jgi:hypothetical protein